MRGGINHRGTETRRQGDKELAAWSWKVAPFGKRGLQGFGEFAAREDEITAGGSGGVEGGGIDMGAVANDIGPWLRK